MLGPSRPWREPRLRARGVSNAPGRHLARVALARCAPDACGRRGSQPRPPQSERSPRGVESLRTVCGDFPGALVERWRDDRRAWPLLPDTRVVAEARHEDDA